MRLQFNNWTLRPLMAPGEGVGLGGDDNDSLETFELLNADDPQPEVLDIAPAVRKEKEIDDDDADKGKKAGEGEEDDELKEIEEELERKGKTDEEEDLLELTTPVRRKDILAKYPSLFKDFPYLEKAYYREQQFTELLPTIQDAKLAVEKAQILDQTEKLVMSGDISSVLQAAKQEDGEAFNKIADNYLSTLRRVDQGAYFHVLGNVMKDTIITMVREANALGEQGSPLKAAANILNQFIFGSQTFSPPVPLARQVNPEEQNRQKEHELQQQNQLFERFNGVREDLQSKADNVLKATIDGHIDPKGTMTDYVKTHAAKEAFSNLEDLIAKDRHFRSLLDKLWEKAFQSGFDKTDTDRIKAAYLSKAKTLLPSVIQKARREALREKRASNASRDEEEELTPRKGPITPGRSASPTSGNGSSKKGVPAGMSTLDYLNS
jgi:hypothetical protein